AYLPDEDNSNQGTLWVNHEYVDSRFVSGYKGEGKKSKAQIDREMYDVGGTIMRIRKKEAGKGKQGWEVIQDKEKNYRVNGHTDIPFNWPVPIKGSHSAMGTLANCSGGITPWGTILTCEENYDQFYGERLEDGSLRTNPYDTKWHEEYPNPPEHYGWVVEVNPKTGKAKKHVALGRCAHECATVIQLEDKRIVVYTGDDANNECLYKFISSKPGSLDEGTLYVANLTTGIWEPLVHDRPELKEVFADQTDLLIHLRKASKLVGGTPLDRPEDIEIDPVNGNVLISLTNNKPAGRYFGAILKVEEQGADHSALKFTSDNYLVGGEETGFACPDNMAFDPRGNLWFTSDISGSGLNAPPYTQFGNNGLYVVPRIGAQAGKVIQVASAPVYAELTGPWFSPDGKTLFLSVQHPGEASVDAENPDSHWPDGGDSMPKPSVVTIQGALLNGLSAI
ncbi:MAG: secreted PhoX family phosphatase, partial [Limisphaerales bacterium]